MRYDWVYLDDENGAGVGVIAPEVAAFLLTRGFAHNTEDPQKLRFTVGLKSPPPKEGIIYKKFTGASADVEIEYLNADDKVRLERALIGTNRDFLPKNASDQLFKSLDAWLMAVHEARQAGHRLSCFTAPKERVAVVLDYDTDVTYSLPFRYLYATSHGVQPPTVRAWGFGDDPLELLRQVRDHNLREILVAGKPDHLTEGVLDALPDEELEDLWKDGAEEVLAAFNAHTALMKKEPGFLKSR
jgi:hypothetical protein